MIRTQVLVIGAGPAGIAAAIAASEAGRRVIVLDDNPSAGGQIWRGGTVGVGRSAHGGSARQRALDRLSRSGATVFSGLRVFDAQACGVVDAIRETASRSSVERFKFEQLILATGARERFLPFPGWTLPGVFGAGGLQALARGGYGVKGKRIVVSGSGPLLLAVAAHLAEDGALISTVAEQAGVGQMARFAASLWSHPGKLMQAAAYRAKLWKTAYRSGCWVTEALPAADGQGLRAVRFNDGSREWEEPCDLLACGFHLVPNTEVASLLGCAFVESYVRVDEAQRTSVQDVYCAGEPTGIAGLEAALTQGEIAGLTCAGRSTDTLRGRAKAERKFQLRLEKAFAFRPEIGLLAKPETIVCRCEDVPFGKLQSSLNWTDAKLQTRCGMGPCQARVCGPAVEHLLGWKPVSVRQPLSPVPIEAFCSYDDDEITREKV